MAAIRSRSAISSAETLTCRLRIKLAITFRLRGFYRLWATNAHSASVNLAEGKMGILGFAVLVIAIMGVWGFATRTWANSHPDSPVAQTLIHFW